MSDWWTSEMPIKRALELLVNDSFEIHDCSMVGGWDITDPHYKRFRLYQHGSMYPNGGLVESEVEILLDYGILKRHDKFTHWIMRAL